MKKIKMNAAKLQLGKKVIASLSELQKDAVVGGQTNGSCACSYPDPREACYPVTYACASTVLGC